MAEKQNIHEANWGNFILAITASILDSAFTQGYHAGLIQEIKKPVEDWLHSQRYSTKLNESIKISNKVELRMVSFSNLIESSYELGGVIGCCFMVMFADKFGRKGGMLMTTFISVFASIFGGYSKYFNSVVLLIISRILYGIKHGINSGLAPMYLMEISPQDKRGLFASSYGFFLSVGILVSKILTQKIANKLHWPLTLSLPVIPAIIQLSLLPFCPESPKYLYVMKKNEWECRKALKWLRGSRYREEEMDNIRQEYNQRAELGEIRLGYILKNRILRSALITSTILVLSQQLCGVTILIKYVNNRFSQTNHDYHVFTLLTIKILGGLIPFFIIERVSRRKILFFSFGGMAVTSFILCAFFEWINFAHNEDVIFFLEAIFLISYKIGCGAICIFSPSEFFNTSAASIAYSVGAGSNWFLRWCVITFGVPFISKLRGYSFLNYMVTNTVLLYYAYTKVPETRNKSIKEVYRSIYAKIK